MLEAGEPDAGDVFVVGAHAETGGADGLLDDVAEGPAGDVERLGEGEGEAPRMASPMASLAATMCLRMARNWTVSASDFFLSSAWPRVAAASRAFTTPIVVTVGTTLSRSPCPAMPPEDTSALVSSPAPETSTLGCLVPIYAYAASAPTCAWGARQRVSRWFRR